jgi:hypothetical protein
MNAYQTGTADKRFVLNGDDYRQMPPADVRPSVDENSLSYHALALAELVKRAEERLEGLRSLADFVAGGEPTGNGGAIGGPKAVALGLGMEMCERIMMLEQRLNAMAHEFGRLDRAIRG